MKRELIVEWEVRWQAILVFCPSLLAIPACWLFLGCPYLHQSQLLPWLVLRSPLLQWRTGVCRYAALLVLHHLVGPLSEQHFCWRSMCAKLSVGTSCSECQLVTCGCLSCMLCWGRTFGVEASFAGVVYQNFRTFTRTADFPQRSISVVRGKKSNRLHALAYYLHTKTKEKHATVLSG